MSARDEAQWLRYERERLSGDLAEAIARIQVLTEALERLREWDILDTTGDGDWAKRIIDAALAQTPTPMPHHSDNCVCGICRDARPPSTRSHTPTPEPPRTLSVCSGCGALVIGNVDHDCPPESPVCPTCHGTQWYSPHGGEYGGRRCPDCQPESPRSET